MWPCLCVLSCLILADLRRSRCCLVSAFLWQFQYILKSPDINWWPLLAAIESPNSVKKATALRPFLLVGCIPYNSDTNTSLSRYKYLLIIFKTLSLKAQMGCRLQRKGKEIADSPTFLVNLSCLVEWVSSWNQIIDNFLVWSITAQSSLCNDKKTLRSISLTTSDILSDLLQIDWQCTGAILIFFYMYSCAIRRCYWDSDRLMAIHSKCLKTSNWALQ